MHWSYKVARLRWVSNMLAVVLAIVLGALPLHAWANQSDWSLGGYVGQYHDTEPAGVLAGRANYIDQYMLALTGAKPVWRSSAWPVSVEIDVMVGYQSGVPLWAKLLLPRRCAGVVFRSAIHCAPTFVSPH